MLELRAADALTPSPALPETLATAPNLAATGELEVDRSFELRGTSINGRELDVARVDEVVEVGTTEVWEIDNKDSSYHNFHIHDVQFQILEIDGAPPPGHLSGWKDTIFMPPDRSARIALRFSDYTDPYHPYMFHCHRLRHEDRGMMGQFVVVEPGQGAGTPPGH